MFNKYKSLSKGKKVLVVSVIAVACLYTIGSSNQPKQTANVATNSAAETSATPKTTDIKPKPTITTKSTTETEPVPFDQKSVNDAMLLVGTSKVTTAGINGIKTLTYSVTYEGDVQTSRTLVKEEITTQPITEITSIGTKAAAQPQVSQPPATPTQSTQCDPNYSGCVPIASDVDCAGGTGNGPAYVRGPINVIGTDIYRLDSNHNGVACE